jgi:perosamine synthetase
MKCADDRGRAREVKAMVYVSLNGRCGDMDEIRQFCKTFNTWLIEDAAQSLGSKWNGKYLGTFGDIGCYSFSTQKVITMGNGGCCVTNSDELAEKLRLFKNFGRASGGNDNYEAFGINLKFTDLQAVIGIEQVKKLRSRLARKAEMGALYGKLLADIRGVTYLPHQTGGIPWFYDILADEREKLIEHLFQHGVCTRRIYPALHRTPTYKGGYNHYKLPVAESVAERGLWLPSSCTLTNGDIFDICGHIEEFYRA